MCPRQAQAYYTRDDSRGAVASFLLFPISGAEERRGTTDEPKKRRWPGEAEAIPGQARPPFSQRPARLSTT